MVSRHSATHVYRLYGMRLQSSLPLPELTPIAGTLQDPAGVAPEVVVDIVEGTVPAALPDGAVEGPTFQVGGDGRFLLRLPGIARYLVEEGRRITVEAERDADEQDLRLFLLGGALGALAYQRGRFPLHASVIHPAGPGLDGGVAFTGASGLGKSTLAATLVQAGHAVISDDICVTDLQPDGRPIVAPGFPRLRLWHDALRRLDRSPEGLMRDRRRLDKYQLPLEEGFQALPVPLWRVYALEEAPPQEAPSIVPVAGLAGIDLLMRNTYRPRFVAAMGEEGRQFKLASGIMERTQLFRLRRPRDARLLPKVVALLEAHWQQPSGGSLTMPAIP